MKPPRKFPEPEDDPVSCNSWVIFGHPKDSIFETFDRKTALHHFNEGLEVKTAYQHLVSLNQPT